MRFAPHLVDDFKRSYEAIRLRADGKVDPTTVDGCIRASTLALVAMRQREEEKKAVSLAQVQDAYFSLLFREFGWMYEQMNRAGANPAQAGNVFARNDEAAKAVADAVPGMAEALGEFWSSVGDGASYHLQDARQLKATFAGDLFPAYWENAVSTAGLYVDTIILPCPITRIAPLQAHMPAPQFVAMLLKHVFTAMSYRDLAVADVDPPIVLIIPNTDDVDQESRKSLVRRADPATRKHAEHLFGRAFESIEHLKDFCDHLRTIEQVLKELRAPDRLIFDTDWDRNPQAQLSQAMTENPVLPGLEQDVAGHHVFSACLGRMPQAMGAQENALHFGGTPLISSETSWLYYSWLLEYEGAPAGGQEDRQSMHVVRALVAEGQNNLEWLGNVPMETVLEIRKRGLAGELRALLGHGVSDLIGINPDNYFRTADQVVDNLERAFRDHQKAISEAKLKKLKLWGIDVTACATVGGVAVAAALTGNVQLGALSGVLGIAGLPTLKDIKTKLAQVVAEDRARRTSPTGLLFRHVRRG